MRMIARFCFFVSLFLLLGVPSGVSYAQGETKIAKGNLWSMTADPSPWEKDPTGLWHLERDAPGGKWWMVMAVVDQEVQFSIRLPCRKGKDEVYDWKLGDEIAFGTNCAGRLQAKKNIAPFEGWIDPLPREVLEVIETKKRRLAKIQKLK